MSKKFDPSVFKKKLENLSNREGGNDFADNYWKPKDGETHVIRIVPHQNPTEQYPIIPAFIHYGFNGKTFLSPKTWGDLDPLDELATKLFNDDKKEMARKVNPSFRPHVPIIVRGEEDQGVRFYGFGKQVYNELIKYLGDDDYGDISDAKTGRDITIKYTPKEKTNDGFAHTSVLVKPNITPVTDSKEVLTKIKEQPSFKDMWKEYTYDELVDMLDEWLESGDSPSTNEVAPSKEESTEAAASSGTTSTSSDDAVDAFDDLFND